MQPPIYLEDVSWPGAECDADYYRDNEPGYEFYSPGSDGSCRTFNVSREHGKQEEDALHFMDYVERLYERKGQKVRATNCFHREANRCVAVG